MATLTTLTDGDDSSIFGGDNDSITCLGGNDYILAGGGNDTVYGDQGNDSISPGAGTDSLFGGDGIDTVLYNFATAGVTASLASEIGSFGSDTDYLKGFENITGSSHGDDLIGDDGDNVLNGL